jgi:hypothetical protein
MKKPKLKWGDRCVWREMKAIFCGESDLFPLPDGDVWVIFEHNIGSTAVNLDEVKKLKNR